MLAIEELRGGYGGSEVLRGVDLAVPRGAVVALMGRNGMGKTTLLRTCLRLVRARSGSVRFDGRDVTHLPTHEIARAGLGYVPQGREVFDDLTVEENLRLSVLGRPGRGGGGGNGREAVTPRRLFEWFPVLAKRRRQRAGTLSGGEQQMLAIARALAAGPAMVLLDEPSEGIQPSVVHDIGLRLRAVAAETGLTLLVVEQNVDLVATLADTVAFMTNGVIVETCPAGDLTAADPAAGPAARHLSL